MVGRPIESELGPVPSASDRTHEQYVRNWLAYRTNELLFAADVTKYVSTSGSDSNNGDSPATAYATIQKARDVREADAGNSYSVLLDANSTFRITDTDHLWVVSADKTRIGSYGAGRATITRSVVFTSGWSLVSGSLYKRSFSTTPIQVFLTGRPEEPTFEADSSANATAHRNTEGVVGAWYYDSTANELFVDFGVNPSGLSIEVVSANSYHGFHLVGDLQSVWDIRTIGFGAGNAATQCQGVTMNAREYQRQGVFSSECWGGGTHSLALYSSGGSAPRGAIVTVADCSAGGCGFGGAAGETVVNFYQDQGESEVLVVNPRVPLGTLPSFRWYNPASAKPRQVYRGIGIFGHTAGATLLSRTCVYVSEFHDAFPDRYFAPSRGANLTAGDPALTQSFANRAAFRAHSVGVRMVRQLGVMNGGWFLNLCHSHRCTIDVKLVPGGILALEGSQLSGLHTACDYRVNLSALDNAAYGLVNASPGVQSVTQLVNCNLIFYGRNVAGLIALNRDGQAQSVGWTMRNCIIALLDSPGSTLRLDLVDGSLMDSIVIGAVDRSQLDPADFADVREAGVESVSFGTPMVGDVNLGSGALLKLFASDRNDFYADIGAYGAEPTAYHRTAREQGQLEKRLNVPVEKWDKI